MGEMTGFQLKYYEKKLTWNSLEKFVHEAKRAKVWIHFHRQWFAPDEFLEYAKSLGSEEQKQYSKIEEGSFKMRDPIVILAQMRTYLDGKEKKLTDFAMRVANYYKNL